MNTKREWRRVCFDQRCRHRTSLTSQLREQKKPPERELFNWSFVSYLVQVIQRGTIVIVKWTISSICTGQHPGFG